MNRPRTRGQQVASWLLLIAILVGIALAVTLSNSSSSPHHSSQQHHLLKVTGHPCDPQNYAMQCALTPPPKGLKATPSIAHGIDFAWSCPNPAGENFGASYLSTDRTKNWTQSCVNLYRARGASVVMVWESASTRALGGFAAGRSDALNARAQAAVLGNTNRPIFFAIDFDETPGQAAAVASYFSGVGSVLGVGRTGAYGGYYVVKRLFDARLVAWGWQTYAWSGGQWDPRAQIEQYLNDTSIDYDRAIAADYGQMPGPAKPKPKPKPKPAADPFHYKVLTPAELRIVLRYDGARKHPAKYAGYLKYVLEPELAKYAHAVWVASHTAPPKPVSWSYRHRGTRFQQLYRRQLGQQLVH